jgi:hypothetical protein
MGDRVARFENHSSKTFGYLCIAGGVMSQNQSDITLTPPNTVVEKYMSDKHHVLCSSPKGIDMKWTHNSAERIPSTKGRYVNPLSGWPL